jgi:hypothetical protein
MVAVGIVRSPSKRAPAVHFSAAGALLFYSGLYPLALKPLIKGVFACASFSPWERRTEPLMSVHRLEQGYTIIACTESNVFQNSLGQLPERHLY